MNDSVVEEIVSQRHYGRTYEEISSDLGIPMSTIAYHARMWGLGGRGRVNCRHFNTTRRIVVMCSDCNREV